VAGTGVREALLKLGKIVHQRKEEVPKPAASWEPELAG